MTVTTVSAGKDTIDSSVYELSLIDKNGESMELRGSLLKLKEWMWTKLCTCFLISTQAPRKDQREVLTFQQLKASGGVGVFIPVA